MERSRTVRALTGAAGGRRKVPRAVREQDMLREAEAAFARRGFHAASVDAIAEAAGISKPMVYAYFGSKEGLYRACMERARERLFDALSRAADAGAEPDEQLWLGLLAFFTFVRDRHDSWAVLLGEVTAGSGPFAVEGAAVRREIADLVGRLLQRAAESEGIALPEDQGMLEPLARALVGAGESLAAWWGEHPGEPAERVALVLMNFAWNGLGGLVVGRRWTPPG